MNREAPETCPNCGADVPRGAKACPECGSDERTGWSDEAYADSLGLPDDSFDYNDFVKREFEGKVPRRSKAVLWWIVAVLLGAAFILLALHGF